MSLHLSGGWEARCGREGWRHRRCSRLWWRSLRKLQVRIQTAFDPPLVLYMYVANFFERLLKKCINACSDKIRQNNAYICGKNVASLWNNGDLWEIRYLSYLGHFWTIWAILDHFGPFLNKSRKTDWPPPRLRKFFSKSYIFLNDGFPKWEKILTVSRSGTALGMMGCLNQDTCTRIGYLLNS